MSYQPKVYREQGGDKIIIASSGELEIQSGGTLDLQGLTGGAASGRGPSTAIWSTCPVLDYLLDPTKGMVLFNDFHGGYALAANQASTYLGGGVQGFTGASAGSTIASLTTDPNGV